MIDPVKDAFARLVVSAKKNRTKNQSLKFITQQIEQRRTIARQAAVLRPVSKSSAVSQPSMHVPQQPRQIARSEQLPLTRITPSMVSKPSMPAQKTTLPSSRSVMQPPIHVDEIPLEKKSLPVAKPSFPLRAISLTPSKKIDEHVADIVENPEVQALKQQLDAAHTLFIRLRKTHADRFTIKRVEEKIAALRALIEQKSYV